MAKSVNPIYKFWVENRKDKEIKYYISDVRSKFQKWLLTKELEWLHFYSCTQVVLTFLSDAKGLNATHEGNKTDEIVRYLKPDYTNMITGINPVTKSPFVREHKPR